MNSEQNSNEELAKQNNNDELEQLDVIEASALSVGSTFHAFRFSRIALEDLSSVTVEKLARAVNHLVETRGISEAEAVASLEKAVSLEERLEDAANQVLEENSETSCSE